MAWSVLVPVEVLEGESVPESLVDLLATVPVVVLGYHVLPEQTPPGQARLQFEDAASATLGDLAAAFRAAGGDAETRLVFTHDEEQTLDRVAEEAGCDAILVPNPATAVERLLVAVRGEADASRIATFVAALIGDRDIAVTVYHVAGADEDIAPGEALVEEAIGTLRDAGLPADVIERQIERSEAPVRAITAAAADYDAVVMGESEPSLRTFLLGESHEAVAARSLGPVLVVRRARRDDPG